LRGLSFNLLNTLGVKVALDDFGTGYSSLTHLRSLPVQTIKIDQTFVRYMLDDDPSHYSIIDGVIALRESFGRTVIAEGVETTEHCHSALKVFQVLKKQHPFLPVIFCILLFLIKTKI